MDFWSSINCVFISPHMQRIELSFLRSFSECVHRSLVALSLCRSSPPLDPLVSLWETGALSARGRGRWPSITRMETGYVRERERERHANDK